MGHYFTNEPLANCTEHRYEFVYRGCGLAIVTCDGVFSKHELDFGTRLLLNHLPELTNEWVLDLGCGAGPVSTALAVKYPQTKIVAVDVNERAVAMTARNAELAGVTNVETRTGDGCTVTERFDLIVFNPPIRAGNRVVHALLLHGATHLRRHGALWVVARKQQGALSLIRFLEEAGFTVTVITKKKGYYVFKVTVEAA